MPLVNTYQQAGEPSDTTPGAVWLRADGTKAQRGLAGLWIEKGSWTQANDGMLSKNGGTVLGPVYGNHGHASIDSPAFTGVITLGGDEVPTKPWVLEQMTTLSDTLQSFITNAIGGAGGAGAGTQVSIGNNLAFASGTIGDGGTISLPKYADGTRAVIGEVCGLLVSPYTQTRGNGGEATAMAYECYVDPATLVVTVRTRITGGGGGANWGTSGTANFLIICKR